jgi:hypothetical protein
MIISYKRTRMFKLSVKNFLMPIHMVSLTTTDLQMLQKFAVRIMLRFSFLLSKVQYLVKVITTEVINRLS